MFRLALRRFVRRPVWTLGLIAVLGGSTGTVLALYSVSYGLFLAPLPFAEPDRVFQLNAPNHVFQRNPERAAAIRTFAESDAFVSRAYARLTLVVQPGGAAARWNLRSAAVSESLFGMLGIQPWRGRFFSDAEARDTPRPALLGYSLWQKHFSSNPGVVGSVIDIPGSLDGRPWRIVGIMPPGFSFPQGANFWLPFDPERHRPTLTPDFARLRDGLTAEAIQKSLPGVQIASLESFVRPKDALSLRFILIATAFLLAAAWSQAGSVLVTRSVETLNSVAIKVALGATRRHLLKEVLVSGVLLAVAALVVGFAVSIVLVPAIVAALPPDASAGHAADPVALGAGLLATVGVLLFLWIATTSGYPHLGKRSGGTIQIRSVRGRWIRPGLLLVQVAAAMSLLYVTALAIESHISLLKTDLGFAPHGLFAVPFPLPALTQGVSADATRERSARRAQEARDAAERIRTLPGVTAAAFTAVAPLSPISDPVSMAVGDPNGDRLDVRRLTVGLGYAGALEARILEGKEPHSDETMVDLRTKPMAMKVLVNQTLARALEASGRVVGQSLWPTTALRFDVAGVINDIKQEAIDHPVPPMVYTFFQSEGDGFALLVRVEGSTDLFEQSVRNALPPGTGVEAVVNLERTVRAAQAGSQARVVALVVIAYCGLASLFVGIAGAVSETLRRERRSVALRIALGAAPAKAIGSTIVRLLASVSLGAVIGLGIGIVVGQVAQSIFVGVEPVDGTSLVLGFAVVILASLMAVTIGAQGTLRADPWKSLRDE